MESMCGGFYIGKKKIRISDVHSAGIMCLHIGARRMETGRQQQSDGAGEENGCCGRRARRQKTGSCGVADMIHCYCTAAYIRLSREDGDKSESDSIANQRALLTSYVEHHDDLILTDCYVDDGWSGTNFQRPEFQRMIRDVERGRIDCILVKDLSRFGRDYIEAGRYLERYFPEKGVRFIAVADQIDSLERTYNLFLPLKNVLNEQYARDISEKVHITIRSKQKQGKFIGAFAAYGYRKDPEDRNHLLVDEPAAAVVRRIFDEYENGKTIREITEELNHEKIPSPSAYKKRCGEKYRNGNCREEEPVWTYSSVCRILHSELYTGAMVQGKKEQYMHRRQRQKRQEEWIVIKGTHEALVDAKKWKNVQIKLLGRAGNRKKVTKI